MEERFHRAAPGGMGGTKAAGNYSPVSTWQSTCDTVFYLYCFWGGMHGTKAAGNYSPVGVMHTVKLF